jgi:hypothetical protein
MCTGKREILRMLEITGRLEWLNGVMAGPAIIAERTFVRVIVTRGACAHRLSLHEERLHRRFPRLLMTFLAG